MSHLRFFCIHKLFYCLKSSVTCILLFICKVDQTQMFPSSISSLRTFEKSKKGNQDFFVKIWGVAHIWVLSIERRANHLHTMALRDWKGNLGALNYWWDPNWRSYLIGKGGTPDPSSCYVKTYWISGQMFRLILSFFSNRRLRVVLDGKAPFLIQLFPYYTLITILMMLSVILLSMCWWYSSLL